MRVALRLGEALAWGTLVAVSGFLLARGFARTVLLYSVPVVLLAALLWSKASRLLVASLIFGIFGLAAWDVWNAFPVFLLAFSVPGVMAGCVAFARARRQSRVRLCFAVAAIAFSAAHVAGYAYVALVMLPVDLQRPAWYPSRTENCRRKLNELARALALYAEQHQGRYPEASVWCDAVKPYLRRGHIEDFQCPIERYARSAHYVLGLPIYTYCRPTCSRSTYGFNKHLSGARFEDIRGAVVVLFECEDSWNFAGSSDDVKFRHRGFTHVLVAERTWGLHVQFLDRKRFGEVPFVVERP